MENDFLSRDRPIPDRVLVPGPIEQARREELMDRGAGSRNPSPNKVTPKPAKTKLSP